jgi:Family of unknown function (DUF6328)
MGRHPDEVLHEHHPSGPADPSRWSPTMARCPQCGWSGEGDHSDWNYVMRGETGLQTVDRHFTELLQELRVAQTGVQILFAFLLGLAFTARFTELSNAEQAVYLVTLVLSATSAALLIAPVSYHRTVFRQRLKSQLVSAGHRYALVGLVLLMLALAGAVQLAASFVLGAWAALLAAALAGLFITLWFVIPLVHRIRHHHRSLG